MSEPEAQPRGRQLTVMLIIACAMFMQNLDSTIIATALPTIAQSIGESPLKLMTFNVHLSNTDWNAIANEVERQDPDVVTLIEFGSGCQGASTLRMSAEPLS